MFNARSAVIMLCALGWVLLTQGVASADGRSGKKQREPQAVSNSQLSEAIAVLEQTEAVLKGADHDYGGHRAATVKAVHHAIDQLKKALAYEGGQHESGQKGKGRRKANK
jgi:hypothetical protein